MKDEDAREPRRTSLVLMANFRNTPEDWNRLDYRLLQNGACHLYSAPIVLDEDVEWLERHGYEIARFDCTEWTDESAMHRDFAKSLAFPDSYGHNLDAFNDCLHDAIEYESSYLALRLEHFDSFARTHTREAHSLLDIIETVSRRGLLWGARLVALLQSDDAKLSLPPVGASAVMWNPREFVRSSRRT